MRSQSRSRSMSSEASSLSKTRTIEEAETPYSNCTIFVKNLPSDITTDEIRDIFQQFGSLHSIILKKRLDVSSICYLKYHKDEHALKTMMHFRNTKIEGRQLIVELARRKMPYQQSFEEHVEYSSRRKPPAPNQQDSLSFDSSETRRKFRERLTGRPKDRENQLPNVYSKRTPKHEAKDSQNYYTIKNPLPKGVKFQKLKQPTEFNRFLIEEFHRGLERDCESGSSRYS